MPRSAEFPVSLAAALLVTAVLAGCTNATAPQATEPSEQPAANDAPKPSATSAAVGDPDECVDPAWINISNTGASVTGEIVDRGAREFAAGDVGLDEEGNIVSYTVAPGDVESVVGERLCITNGLMLATLNHTRTIHPDQVLRLNPDPDILFIPYHGPWDAPAGFRQIPYQAAIEAMGKAVDLDDVDALRAIWADELSGMFTNPAEIDAIEQALDAGDLDVLRQMFS